jgi:hypothetical protein
VLNNNRGLAYEPQFTKPSRRRLEPKHDKPQIEHCDPHGYWGRLCDRMALAFVAVGGKILLKPHVYLHRRTLVFLRADRTSDSRSLPILTSLNPSAVLSFVASIFSN